MGNTQAREQRPAAPPEFPRSPSESQQLYTAADGTVYTARTVRTSHGNIFGRSAAREEPQDEAGLAQRRLNKLERENRKKEEKEAARKRERERSWMEESVDGGYLVTSGLYIKDEDYNKTVVRQLMVDRRLAPFYFGLEDHRETWTEHQLIAAVHGKDIPPADEPPTETAHWPPADGPAPHTETESASTSNTTTLPIPTSPFGPSPSSPLSSPNASKSRARNSGSLGLPSPGSPDQHQNETHLSPQPTINGQRLEVYLYKDVVECEICYRSFPPYSNRTRCCDKPVCSECFVSMKRKDPHPTEHEDGAPSEPHPRPVEQANPADELGLDEIDLVSEPAKCPFCNETEFGVTYAPPPFRTGLVRATAQGGPSDALSSPQSQGGISQSPHGVGRPRAASLPATASAVVTTDKIRPDWAKKLLQAKLNVAKRAQAATALHQQAFMPSSSRSRLGIFRRGTGDSPGDSEDAPDGEGTPLDINRLIAAAGERRPTEQRRSSGLSGARSSSRAQELALEAQYREAYERAMRESIEDEQRRAAKAEKERQEQEKRQAKEQKQKAKEEARQQKQADKAAKKSGSVLGFPRAMRSTTSVVSSGRDSSASIESGKGKGPAPSSPDTSFGTQSTEPSALESSASTSGEIAGGKANSKSSNSRSQSQTNFGSLNALVEKPQESEQDSTAAEHDSDFSAFSRDMLSSMNNIMTGGSSSGHGAETAGSTAAESKGTSKPEAPLPSPGSATVIESKQHEVEVSNPATGREFGSV